MGKVTYGQSGYCGSSMSVRAAEAYADGEMPKSKWTKAAMLEAMEEYAADNDLIVKPGVCKMRKADIFERWFYQSSWHHTGKYANVTDFYSLLDDEETVAEWTWPKPVVPVYTDLGTVEVEILGKPVTMDAYRVDPPGNVNVAFSVIDRSGAMGILQCGHEVNMCCCVTENRWHADEIGASNWYEYQPDEAAELAEELGLPALIAEHREALGI